jgi:hypothetical protein
MNNKELLLERILLNMRYDSRMTLSENMLILETTCDKYQKTKDLELIPNTGSIQQYLSTLGSNITVDYSFGNGTATAVWTYLFGDPKTTKTPNELWTKLNNSGYDVGTTPGIGYQTLKAISDKFISIRNSKLSSCQKTDSSKKTFVDLTKELKGLTPGSDEWVKVMQNYNAGQTNDNGCPPNYKLVTDPQKIAQLNTDNRTNLDTKRALAGPQRSNLYSGMNFKQTSKGGWCELTKGLGNDLDKESVAEIAHSFLTVVELGTLALAFIPTPLSPLLFGISMAAGVADAGVYFAEGDKYMGSMMLALEVIPGGELVEIFAKGGSKVFKTIGKKGSKELLEKDAKGLIKNSVEKSQVATLKQEIKNVTQELVQGTEKQIVKNVTEKLPENYLKAAKAGSMGGTEMFFDSLFLLWKSIGKLPQLTIKVGGTMWGVDQLYLALYGRDEDRQQSDIRKLYYWIQSRGLPEEEEMARVIAQASQNVKPAEEQVLQNIKVTKTSEPERKSQLYKYMKTSYTNNVQRKKAGYAGSGKEVELPVPTVDEVLSGSKNFTFGMKGDEIFNLKRKLKLNYGNFVPELEKTIQNNEFDMDFLVVINDFQQNVVPSQYDKKISNERYVVGKETYQYIMNNPLQKMEIKPISTDDLVKDQYDYFIYQPRTKQFLSTTYEDYLEQQKVGNQVKKQLKQQNLQGLDRPDPTVDMSKRQKKKYDKKYEEMKNYYNQLMLLKTLTPEQRKFLDDFKKNYMM